MSVRIRWLAAVREELGPLGGDAVGIGPVRAAAGAASVLYGRPAEAVVLVGTAGTYATAPGAPGIGEVVVARSIGLSGGLAEVGLGYVPLAPAPLTTDPGLRGRLGLREVDVLTVEAITTDVALAAARGAVWQVEHMEAWSVAHVAALLGLPFVAVLGITNEVGPDAHVQWRQYRARVEAAVVQAVSALSGTPA